MTPFFVVSQRNIPKSVAEGVSEIVGAQDINALRGEIVLLREEIKFLNNKN